MSTIAWIILLILLIPALALLGWVILSASFIRIPTGRLGLLVVRGRATDTTLPPGMHFIFALRRRMVVTYPAVEMTYRAGGAPEAADQSGLDFTGPPVSLFLGDRASAIVSFTVRFRLVPDQLRLVHERYGPGGIFGIVRDRTTQALTSALGRKEITVDDLFGGSRDACQQSIGTEIADVLQADGVEVTTFLLGAVELGRTGEVIQAISRARHELEQERVDAATRLARAANDVELEDSKATTGEAAWRYRETDLWRELIQRRETLNIALQSMARGPVPPANPGPNAPGIANPEQQR
jgi:regulator of protease activity HflC (stomatin/prohibitin superfamily)